MRSFALAIVFLLVGFAYAPLGIANDPSVAPAEISAWVEAAEKCAAADRKRDALIIYQRVLQYIPDDSSLLNTIGKLHYQLADFVAAAESFSRAAQFAPDRASYHNDAGCAYLKAKEYRLAMEHLKKAVKLDPKRLRYANNLATLYVDIGDDEKAVSTLSNAHKNLASVHFNMAYLYEKRHRNDEAMAHVEEALSHDPNLARAMLLRNKLARRDPQLLQALTSPEGHEDVPEQLNQ